MSRCARTFVFACGLMCALGSAVLMGLVSLGITDVIDAQLLVAVRALRSPVLSRFMLLMTRTGGWWFVAAGTALVVALLLFTGRRRDAAVSVVILAGGVALSTVLKTLIGRVRPPAASALTPLPASEAFPSGHAVASACLAAVLLLALAHAPRRARAMGLLVALVYPALVGFSRVYLGVHWPTDVVAALLLAGAWSACVVWAGATWRAEA